MKKTILVTLLLFVMVSLNAQIKKVNFTEQYKKDNNGKYKIEIDEVKELIHIMLAITKYGLSNDDMFQQNGKYYQDVVTHFKPYENDRIIITFDSLLQQSPLNYIFLTGNAITYDFDNDKLVPDKIFLFTGNEVAGVKITINPITTYKKEIEDFGKRSGFRAFYASHNSFYQGLIADYDKNANLNHQWKWLEKNFKTKINSYQILCSPLINGLNYTGPFKDNNFELVQMVLPPIEHNSKWTKNFTEAFNTRGIFTEIDHNYVGMPSSKYQKEINDALKERGKWVDTTMGGTKYYSKPEKVFNEYMTYGVFILYCEDKYKNDAETLKAIYNDVKSVMSKQRGFIKMNEFTDYLVKLRQKHRHEKIDNLYAELLKWCAAQ